MSKRVDQEVLSAHAQFGGDVEDMQRRYQQNNLSNWLEQTTLDGISRKDAVVSYVIGIAIAVFSMFIGYVVFVP